MAAAEHDARPGWHASLGLEFTARAGRTVLARRTHAGPLVVQRPFYPEGGVCHVYLVHPPGGVVGGDRLEVNATVAPGAHVLITTPAATKFYRSENRLAGQVQTLTLADAATEWLPQETILFPDAHARLVTRVHLSQGSRFIGWEIVCYGRPASGLLFTSGRAHQDFELWLDDAPLVLDHLRLDGAGESMNAAFGLAGLPVLGTLFAYPANEATLHAARQVSPQGLMAACTNVDGALVCRAAASQADAVRRHFIDTWSLLRPLVMGREAVLPRIWAT